MPKCSHEACDHNLAVQGDCGARLCPRNNPGLGASGLADGSNPARNRVLAYVDPISSHEDSDSIVYTNAFPQSTYVDPDMVVGREHHLNTALNIVGDAANEHYGNPRILLFTGPTSSGKSALLAKTIAELEDPERFHKSNITVANAVASRDLEDEIKLRLVRDHGGVWARMTRSLNDQQISIGTPKEVMGTPAPLSLSWSGKMGNKLERMAQEDLSSLIEQFSKQSHRRGKPLVLVVDANEQLNERVLSKIAEGVHKAEKNRTPCVAIITSDRNGDILRDRLVSSDYSEIIRAKAVNDLTESDVQHLLKLGMERSGGQWQKGTLEYAAALAKRNSRMANLIGYQSVKIAKGKGGKPVSKHDVDSIVLGAAQEKMRGTYLKALRATGVEKFHGIEEKDLTDESKVLLVIDSHQSSGNQPSRRQIARDSQKSQKEVSRLLHSLRQKGLVDVEGTNSFRSRVPYISKFWMEQPEREFED